MEFRTDVLTGRRILLAPERQRRPVQRAETVIAGTSELDPFLEGNESETPREVLALRRPDTEPDTPGWVVRVVPNRFPAVEWAADTLRHGERSRTGQNAATEPAHGIHEVVVECPDHRTSLTDLSVTEVGRILTAWQLRSRSLAAFPKMAAISIFRNEGAAAGASLPHCHSQIVATEMLPPLLAARHRRHARYFAESGRCLNQCQLEAAVTDGHRVVTRTERIAVYCPYAPLVAGHTRLAPLPPSMMFFGDTPAEDIAEMARLLRQTVVAMRTWQSGMSFNLCLIQPGLREAAAFPWYLEILPRWSQFAGWELMSDIPIVTTPPEHVAASLRDTMKHASSPAGMADAAKERFVWVGTP